MKNLEERRKFISLEVPLNLKYIARGDSVRKEVTTKDLSCEGLRFTNNEELKEGLLLELNMNIPNTPNPVHVNGKVVWAKSLSTEDGSSFDVGVEFIKIEEDNKNTFLRYLCDLIYNQTKMIEHN